MSLHLAIEQVLDDAKAAIRKLVAAEASPVQTQNIHHAALAAPEPAVEPAPAAAPTAEPASEAAPAPVPDPPPPA